MKRVVGFRFIAFTGLALVVPTASEAALVRYTFDQTPIDAPAAGGNASATNFTAVGLTLNNQVNSGTNVTPPITGYTSTGTMSTGTASGTKRAPEFPIGSAASFSTTSYYTFTLTPSPILDLQTIALDYAKGGDAGTRGFAIRYSFDNFATFQTAGAGEITNTTTGITEDFTRHTFTLDDQVPALQQTASPVEFRIYGYVGASGQQLRFDNIEVTGIPEPTSLALVGVGALGLLARRRRAK